MDMTSWLRVFLDSPANAHNTTVSGSSEDSVDAERKNQYRCIENDMEIICCSVSGNQTYPERILRLTAKIKIQPSTIISYMSIH